MKTTIVRVDLAKNCFQLAEADDRYRIVRRERFTRTRFTRWMSNHPCCLVVMEACGSAHYWARGSGQASGGFESLPFHQSNQ